MKRYIHHYLVAASLIFIIAIFLRTIYLDRFPSGLHLDEVWVGYNSWLILRQSINIYGDRFPLTLNMFGDFVPALGAYFTAPFIAILGLNVWAIRLTPVVFSLATMVVSSWFLYRLTRSKPMTLTFLILFAVSPLNIIMSRASSLVIIDTFFLLLFLALYYHFISRHESGKLTPLAAKLNVLVLYLISVIAYYTYFTSRVLLVPFALLLLVYAAIHLKIPRQRLLTYSIPLIAYLIFPFATLLNTPFATGRFHQTTVINSPQLQIDLNESIFRSGTAGVPVWLTRVFVNKITFNLPLVFRQWLTFFSPDTVLFKSSPPARYHVPLVGAVTLIEYAGFFLALIYAFSPKKLKYQNQTRLVIGWLLLSAIPSALTIDDFPNFQRAVVMTPFWQLTASLGLVTTLINLKYFTQNSIPVIVFIAVIPQTIFGIYQYTIQAPLYQPHFRNFADVQLAKWINANAFESRILADSRNFIYPYFVNQENLLDYPVAKDTPYYLTAPRFTIGNRLFLKDLCRQPEIITADYDYLILYTFQDWCEPPWWFTKVYDANYSDGVTGFTVLKPDFAIQQSLRQKWAALDPGIQDKWLLDNLSPLPPKPTILNN